MKSYSIKNCRVCGSSNLENILSLGNFYLSDFLKTKKKPHSFPLTLLLCTSCYLLQLKDTIPSSLLYTERYGYKSGINNTMKQELKEIAKKAKKYKVSKNPLVIDIGANDGTLLRFFPSSFQKVGVEPVKKLATECAYVAENVINDFFSYKACNRILRGRKADIITAISCFYDIEEPNIFVEDVKKMLNDKGVFIIQQNYLKGMLELNAFDNIVHEHLEYYSMLSLTNLLVRHELEIFDVEMSAINGGSFRTYISHKGVYPISKRVHTYQKQELTRQMNNKKTYVQFANRVHKNGLRIKKFIEKEFKKGKRIFVYGASTRGNTLLQFYKLDSSLIEAAVERNSEKFGTYFASVGIPIISEQEARTRMPDYMLVLPWFFKEEFLEREKEYLRKGGHFIFPLPTFEVI